MRVVRIPFTLCQKLQEGIESFIKPGPLPLITIDDHRKIRVAYLMDDGRDCINFGCFGIGSIFFRTTWIKTDHWIFHSISCLNRDSTRIWVGDRIFGIYFQGMRNCLCRISAIDRVGLFGIIAHAHSPLAVFIKVRHRIPDKFPARCPRKIPHIVSFVDPCFCSFWIIVFLRLLRFFERNDFNWFSAGLGFFPTLVLIRS